MAQTAINLYSVRDLDEPMLDILDRVADAGYDGVQFSGGFRDTTATEVKARIDHHGLGVSPAHIGIDSLENDLETILDNYQGILGISGAVIPHLGEEHFESREAVDKTAARLAAIANELDDHGLDLHYHNHAHEFIDFGDETGFERFARKSGDEVLIELDVGWALVGGSDPVGLIERYGDRIDILHMKDMDSQEDRGFREIGEGDVDMVACARAGVEAGVEWLIYEHDDPADPATSIDTGAAFLNGL